MTEDRYRSLSGYEILNYVNYLEEKITTFNDVNSCKNCKHLIHNSITRCRKDVSIGIPFSCAEEWYEFYCNRFEKLDSSHV